MDNISHTLMSIGLGATMARRLPAPLRRVCIWTAVIAGNLPDIDIITSIFSRQTKLVYLLHHRGHTHTIPYILLTGLLVGWIAWRLNHKKVEEKKARARTGLLWAGVLGAGLHLFMDWWNIYGVHPFYPFDNRWYYGDAIFIVEPLIWMSLVPFCFALSRKLRYQALVVAVPIFGFALAIVFKTYLVSGLLLLWLAIAHLWQRWRPQHHSGFILCTVVIAAFFTGSYAAIETARTPPAVPATGIVLDSGLTPAPGNPWCWKFYTVSRDGDDYVVRSGTISHFPALISAATCFPSRGEEKTVSYTDTANSTARIFLEGEYRIATAELTELLANCEFHAMALFARMPFLAYLQTATIFGDLRFDNEPGLGFSEFALDPSADCEGLNLPPWVPPRADVLYPK